MEMLWALIGFILTLLVFSYLLGDNFLFRLVTYVLVGLTAGYMVSVVIYQVLWPRLIFPLVNGSMNERLFTLVPLVLGALLLTRLFPRLRRLGNLPMGYLVGLGAAVAIGGAVLGTIVGQTSAVFQGFGMGEATSADGAPLARVFSTLVGLIGTVATLAYFQFSKPGKDAQEGKAPAWKELASGVGQVFIAITLGALFAGVLSASITALIDRMEFLRDFIYLFR